MNDNVKKVFEILGVEPNEEFKVIAGDESNITYKFKFDENLQGYYFSRKWVYADESLRLLLNGYYKIIKLPKKKKLRDLTPEEWDKWKDRNCYTKCGECIFKYTSCILSCNEDCWVNHKDLYSEKFLNQEIEVEE